MSGTAFLRLLRIAFSIVGVWLGIGALSVAHYEIVAAAGAAGMVQTWHETIAAVLGWALFTPVVMYVAERLKSIAAMVGAAIVAAAGGCALTITASWLMGGMTLRAAEVLLVTASIYFANAMFAAFVIGAATWARLHRTSLERQLRAAQLDSQLADARLRRLRADLQPHFLFNTLNAVATLVHVDSRAAEAAIGKLVDLLGRSADTRDRAVVPLREELDFAARYLDLQKIRFGERLRSSIDVADAGLLDAGVPPFILQPIIENSVTHGLQRRRSAGKIEVKAFAAADGLLRLEVHDDGPGCDPGAVLREDRIGVSHTRARLEALYRRADLLQFRSAGGAFVTEIRIPLS